MDNNALWRLTAESVSDVFRTSEHDEVEIKYTSAKHQYHQLATDTNLNVNIVFTTTRRVVREKDFSLSSEEKNRTRNEKKVLMVR
ncbi:hypothetical protein [Photobacterium damselae]|uniref:hypothetical protein n=1 Tax=Photobacterium damselae TaxID=38293 RepID=UPI0015A1FDD3|nr:hypothetical protein [Photobacterium damselae]NVO61959.1 hypothetical protein [Photobacterium damselae subsp. damselae]